MIIHITRHGQIAAGGAASSDPNDHTSNDPLLSALGQKQADLLGRRLAALGFRGPILCSPYRRTLETAALIAERVDARIIPEPALQEYVPGPGRPDVKGLTASDILRLYARAEFSEALPDPWFVSGPETQPDVRRRLRPFIAKLLALAHPEVLLVGHGATVHGLIHEFIPGLEYRDDTNDPCNWNCSLTTLQAQPPRPARLVRRFDVAHLPAGAVTSNHKHRLTDQSRLRQ